MNNSLFLTVVLLVFISLNVFTQNTDDKKVIDSLNAKIEMLEDSIENEFIILKNIEDLNNIFSNDYNGDKKERVQLGLSFAYSSLSKNDKNDYRLPYISQLDSTLQFQELSGQFILISTTMTVSPFLYADWINNLKGELIVSNSKIKKGKFMKNYLPRFGLWILENSGIAINVNFLEITTNGNEKSFNEVVEGGIGYSLRLNKNIYFSLTRELKFFEALNESYKEGQQLMSAGNIITDINQISSDDPNFYHSKTFLHSSARIIVNF